jgi:hypothetical protein
MSITKANSLGHLDATYGELKDQALRALVDAERALEGTLSATHVLAHARAAVANSYIGLANAYIALASS